MNENLVTSLKLSRELKELGVPQKSEFYWVIRRSRLEPPEYWEDIYLNAKSDKEEMIDVKFDTWESLHYSAFLTGELGEMLPKGIKLGKDILRLFITYDDVMKEKIKDSWTKPTTKRWIVAYGSNKNQSELFSHKYLSEAMGKMLAYLIKNKLYDPKK